MIEKQPSKESFLRRLLRRFGDTAEEVEELVDEELKEEEERHPPTLLEWAGRLISLLLIIGLAGYVTWVAIQPDSPPSFEFQLRAGEVEQRGGSWVTPMDVRNAGTQSVSDLTVTIQLLDAAGEVIEEEDVEFALLGHGEQQDIELWFDEDPREYDIRFDVGSYKVR